MNMRAKKITIAIILACAASILAQDAVNGKPRKRRRLAGTPGYERVLAPAVGSKVVVVNEQERVPAHIIDKAREKWHSMVWLHSDYMQNTKEKVLADSDCALAVCIVDKPGSDVILVSPEGRWVELNTAALATDNPDAKTLEKRVGKEMWRALAYGMGVGNERMPSILNFISSLKELDENEYDEPSPDAFNAIIYAAAKRNMARVRYTSYRQACIEGWAPAPTNDAQRAFFEQAKADKERGPTKPIVIPPPRKK